MFKTRNKKNASIMEKENKNLKNIESNALLAKKIFDVIKNGAPIVELSDEQIGVISSAIINTIDNLTYNYDKETKDKFISNVMERYDYMLPFIFKDVNPIAFENNVFDQELNKRVNLTANQNSIHLELGAYIRWPEDRTSEYIKEENIGDVIRLDMNADFDLDVAASVTALPFADNSIDRIYSNSLFEHVPYPHEIIKESFRVLKPGGFLLTVVPFHFVEHGCPGDFLRYTASFFAEVGKDVGFVDIHTDSKTTSGVYNTAHQFLKAGVPMSPDSHPFSGVANLLHVYLVMMTAGGISIDNLFHAQGASCWLTTYAVMTKPGEYVPSTHKPDRSKPLMDRYDFLVCPKSGLPLVKDGEQLKSVDGTHVYEIRNGKPDLFVMHGFNSGFLHRASTVEIAKKYFDSAK